MMSYVTIKHCVFLICFIGHVLADEEVCIGENGEPLTTPLFGKEGECKNYYQCVHGHIHTVECPYDLVFNPRIRHCDYANNVRGCEDHDGIGAEEVFCRDSNGVLLTQSPFLKPGTCDVFYQCVDGRIFELQCPPNLHFNPKIGVCDWLLFSPPCKPGITEYPPIHATTTSTTTTATKGTTRNTPILKTSTWSSAETTSKDTATSNQATRQQFATTNRQTEMTSSTSFATSKANRKEVTSLRNLITTAANEIEVTSSNSLNVNATRQNDIISAATNPVLVPTTTSKTEISPSSNLIFITTRADGNEIALSSSSSTTVNNSISTSTSTNTNGMTSSSNRIPTTAQEEMEMASSTTLTSVTTTTTTATTTSVERGMASSCTPINIAYHFLLLVIFWYICA